MRDQSLMIIIRIRALTIIITTLTAILAITLPCSGLARLDPHPLLREGDTNLK